MARKLSRPILVTPQPPPPAVNPSLLPQPQLPLGLSAHAVSRLREIAATLAQRKMEASRLYRPLLEQGRFHASPSTLRLLRGSNRGGKTLPAAVEVARAVTGRDPHGKYPTRDGRCFAVGKDLNHIGQVMWRKLSRAGAFRMIRDLTTGDWRAFDPTDPGDDARFKESKPAPPLIPPRMIHEISWENKKEGVPKSVKLKTGWELNFYSSLGKPPKGSDIDLWWFDEEIVDAEWLPEMQARILDRQGKGIWSATPQAGTEQLYELHELADKLKEEAAPEPEVEEFVILLSANPHIREKEKEKFAASLSEEEKKVRVDGNFLLLSYLIYAGYRPSYHNMKTPDPDKMLDWSYFAVVDPGHQVCAVLFGAVPPPPLDFQLLYDELYLKDCTAAIFAKEMEAKCQGKTFQAFLIDPNMALVTDVGYGKAVGEQYTLELRKRGVSSVQTGSSFIYAIDDVNAGHLAVQGLLAPRADGTPKLRVDVSRCPNFDYEIKRYHRKRNPDGTVSEKPYTRKATHLMDCLRYWAMYDPKWVKPTGMKRTLNSSYEAFQKKLERMKAKGGEGTLRFGPTKRD